jgi:hypothetical protein
MLPGPHVSFSGHLSLQLYCTTGTKDPFLPNCSELCTILPGRLYSLPQVRLGGRPVGIVHGCDFYLVYT